MEVRDLSILFIISKMGKGGAQHIVLDLANAMAAGGAKVDLLIFYRTAQDQSILAELLDGLIDEDEARLRRERMWRPHTNGLTFGEAEDVEEWIANLSEFFEQDYDDYLEENRYEIVQMERYEMWKNEY